MKKSIFKGKHIINNLSMIFLDKLKFEHKMVNVNKILVILSIVLIVIKTIKFLLMKFKQ